MKRATFITWEQLRVGLVILVALLLVVVAIYRLGATQHLFADRYQIHAFVESASGIRVGSQVSVAGQGAGSVREIDFLPVDQDTTRNIRLLLEIDRNLQEQIRGDSRAQVRTMGLLGDKTIDITTGTTRYDALQEGDTILVSPSLDYEQVIARASEAVDDMVQLTADLREITGGVVRGEGTIGQLVTNQTLYDQLTGTLERANSLMLRLSSREGTVGRMLDDPAMYERTVSTLARMDTLLAEVSRADGTIGRLMRDDTLYVRMVSMTNRADSLLTMLTTGEGFAARMLHDQDLYDQFLKSVTDLNAILEDVRRDPSRYMRGVIKVF